MESVTEDRIFEAIILGESVSRIRELTSGADFDIFELGSRSDRIRFEGAERLLEGGMS